MPSGGLGQLAPAAGPAGWGTGYRLRTGRRLRADTNAAKRGPRDPSQTPLDQVVAEHLETFLAALDADLDARGLPAYVEREFYDYWQCGVLAHGFLRLGCDTCHHELLLAFRYKRRGFCPSCAGRRMAHTAAHLVAQVIPWVPTRPWVVSSPCSRSARRDER